MKVLCAGLSKTGTTTLHDALTILGYQSIHYDTTRLNDILFGETVSPTFRRYDDVDAVGDIPAAYFFEELASAYQDAKVILTVRDIEKWWRSIDRHFRERLPIIRPSLRDYIRSAGRMDEIQKWREANRFRERLRTLVYGSPVPEEFLYKKKFRAHNAAVQAKIPADRLLVVDVTTDSRWEPICDFLELPVPRSSFPHANASD